MDNGDILLYLCTFFIKTKLHDEFFSPLFRMKTCNSMNLIEILLGCSPAARKI